MRISKDFFLFKKPIAHRGLWGDGIIENSITAYSNAVNNGFPIEIDVFPTSDGEIVCFHDDDTFRMTGVKGNIWDKTLSELKKLSLYNSNERIPTLKEVLNTVNGKVPLLIEFKRVPKIDYIKSVIDILNGYNGEFAVQSFDPFILRKIKRLAPNYIRGILGTNNKPSKSKLKNYVAKHLPFNFLCKPDFISYDYHGFPLKTKLPLLAWTITSKEIQKKVEGLCDNIIFEGFKIEKTT